MTSSTGDYSTLLSEDPKLRSPSAGPGWKLGGGEGGESSGKYPRKSGSFTSGTGFFELTRFFQVTRTPMLPFGPPAFLAASSSSVCVAAMTGPPFLDGASASGGGNKELSDLLARNWSRHHRHSYAGFGGR